MQRRARAVVADGGGVLGADVDPLPVALLLLAQGDGARKHLSSGKAGGWVGGGGGGVGGSDNTNGCVSCVVIYCAR